MLSSEISRIPVSSKQQPITDKQKELKEVTQKFEAVFLSILMKGMRKTVSKNELFHGGFAEDVFQDMLDVKIAESMAQNGGGLGIARMLFNYFSNNGRFYDKK